LWQSPAQLDWLCRVFVRQAKQDDLHLGEKQGRHFCEPDDETFKAAAAGADWNKSFYQLITNQPGKNAWPISTATFILMHIKQDKPANATETFKFFSWAFKNGDKTLPIWTTCPCPSRDRCD
jgi:phosphate transport system substrate-binding protein